MDKIADGWCILAALIVAALILIGQWRADWLAWRAERDNRTMGETILAHHNEGENT